MLGQKAFEVAWLRLQDLALKIDRDRAGVLFDQKSPVGGGGGIARFAGETLGAGFQRAKGSGGEDFEWGVGVVPEGFNQGLVGFGADAGGAI